jgi:hypothetical protein
MLDGWRAGGTFGDYRRAIEALDPTSYRPWAAASLG